MILPKLSLSGPGGFREGMRNPVTTLIKLRVQELWKTETKSKVLNHLTEGPPGQEVIWIPELFSCGIRNPDSAYKESGSNIWNPRLSWIALGGMIRN